MAEKDRESLASIDFGIEATELAGSYKAAEAFLAGEVTTPEDVKDIDEEDEEEVEVKEKTKTPKKPALKKEEAKKEDVDPFANFKEDGEEDEEEEGNEDKAKKAKKKEEEEDEEEGKEDENKKGEDEPLNVEALARDLFTQGVFTPVEGEEDVTKIKIDTPELLQARFQKEGQIKGTQWLEGFLGRFGDDRRDLFDAIFMDGVDPQEYVPLYNEIQNLEGADLTNEAVQEKIYREYYSRVGWTEEAVNKKLQKVKDYGDLADEVQELHPQLVQQDKDRAEEMRQEKVAANQRAQKADNDYKIGIAKILEEKAKLKDFDGIPLNDEKKRKAFDFLYTKKYKNAAGQQLTDYDKFIIDTLKPENFSTRIKIALLALDQFDLTKIEKRAVSKESSTLFSELAQKKIKKAGGSSQGAQPASHKITPWKSL